jgi:hypothetical protein
MMEPMTMPAMAPPLRPPPPPLELAAAVEDADAEDVGDEVGLLVEEKRFEIVEKTGSVTS